LAGIKVEFSSDYSS